MHLFSPYAIIDEVFLQFFLQVVDGMSKEVLSRHLENLRKEFNSETVFLTHFIVEIDENHSKHRHNPIVVGNNFFL